MLGTWSECWVYQTIRSMGVLLMLQTFNIFSIIMFKLDNLANKVLQYKVLQEKEVLHCIDESDH